MLFAVTVTVAMAAQTPMQQLSQQYLDKLFEYSPTAASMVGYHDKGVDRRLDDNSPTALKGRSGWLLDFSRQIETLKGELAREDAADLDLLRQSIALELLELDEAHEYQRRCDQPVDGLVTIFFM